MPIFLDHYYNIFKQCSERSDLLLKHNAFLTCSWRFLRSNILEQLKLKLEKLLGIRNLQEKLEKVSTDFQAGFHKLVIILENNTYSIQWNHF